MRNRLINPLFRLLRMGHNEWTNAPIFLHLGGDVMQPVKILMVKFIPDNTWQFVVQCLSDYVKHLLTFPRPFQTAPPRIHSEKDNVHFNIENYFRWNTSMCMNFLFL